MIRAPKRAGVKEVLDSPGDGTVGEPESRAALELWALVSLSLHVSQSSCGAFMQPTKPAWGAQALPSS